jgi:hypothetical protein
MAGRRSRSVIVFVGCCSRDEFAQAVAPGCVEEAGTDAVEPHDERERAEFVGCPRLGQPAVQQVGERAAEPATGTRKAEQRKDTQRPMAIGTRLDQSRVGERDEPEKWLDISRRGDPEASGLHAVSLAAGAKRDSCSGRRCRPGA